MAVITQGPGDTVARPQPSELDGLRGSLATFAYSIHMMGAQVAGLEARIADLERKVADLQRTEKRRHGD